MTQSHKVTPLEDHFPFDIISHLVPVAPFREYPYAIIDEKRGLCLSVKQYVPRSRGSISVSKAGSAFASAAAAANEDGDGDSGITIIAAGGLGFIKELYEPLFADLFHRAKHSGVNIRSIWMADMFNIGESAVANRENLGCDPAWIDHARDLWCVINHFRNQMPKPIFGLGHSFGCNQLLCLSSWHPSLFHSFAFIEPGIDRQYGRGITIPWALQTLKQKAAWPTREEAEVSLVKAHDAQSWDERVVARLKHYAISQHQQQQQQQQQQEAGWSLTTPKDQVVALTSRLNSKLIGIGPGAIKEQVTLAQRELIPDSDPKAFNIGPFYRRELSLAWDLLPGMRPWVLYVNGSNSPFFGYPQTRDERAQQTGTGIGGNGGLKLGAVKQVIVDGGQHTIVFDKDLGKVVAPVADWLVAESRRWVEGPKKRRDSWLRKSDEEKKSVGAEYVAALAVEMRKLARPGRL